jgi:hypothetical protein
VARCSAWTHHHVEAPLLALQVLQRKLGLADPAQSVQHHRLVRANRMPQFGQ